MAKETKLEMGDRIQFNPINSTEFFQAEITGISEKIPGFNDLLVDWNNQFKESETGQFRLALIESENEKATLLALEEMTRQYPELQINRYEQSLQQSHEMSKQRWTIFILVLVVILLSVMLGVINTIISNINTKRKELAVLRTISLMRQEVVKFILTQVFVYITLGVLFGVITGVIITIMISKVDEINVIFDMKVIFGIIIMMYLISVLTFIPFGKKISKLNLIEELTEDNK